MQVTSHETSRDESIEAEAQQQGSVSKPLTIRNLRGHDVGLTDAGVEAIRNGAAQGLSRTSIAALLGVHRDTLGNIMRRDKRAEAAFYTGRMELEHELSAILLTHARSTQRSSVLAAIYLTKSRLGWVEPKASPDVEVNVNSGVLVAPTGTTSETTPLKLEKA